MTALTTHEHLLHGDRGRIYVQQWRLTDGTAGDRPPIVLFHDSLGCVALWRDFPARLAQATGHDVIAYDRLGFGRSDPSPHRLSPLRFVAGEAGDGFRLVHEGLGLARFVAFGHSVGGGMAIGCAAAYPAHCRAVITESAQVFAEERTLQGIRDAQRAFSEPEQMQRLAKYHGDKAPWVLSAWVDSWLAPEFARWHLDDALRGMRCPVLAIHGDNDEYGSVAHPRRLAEQAGGPATVHILEGCGHVPHREKEAALLEPISAWLSVVAR